MNYVFKKMGYSGTEEVEELMDKNNTVALMVIQNDTIKYQWYSGKHDASSQFTSFSMAKSWISALIGIAIEEGHIKSINEPITNYIKSFKNPGFEEITIEHVLNMRTGIDYVENYYSPFGNVAVGYYGRNLDKHLSKIKIKGPPDQEFEYISIGTQILGVILEEATGKTVTEYCQEKIWEPLGMEYDASWSLDRKNGREKSFCCLNARTTDYAKFGRLYLNMGNWEGTQVIPEEWVRASVIKTMHSKDSEYGYQWWHEGPMTYNNPGIVNYMAQGHLGQYLYMCPEKNTIIIRLGKNRGNMRWRSFFMNICRRI